MPGQGLPGKKLQAKVFFLHVVGCTVGWVGNPHAFYMTFPPLDTGQRIYYTKT